MAATHYLWNPISDDVVEEYDDGGTTVAIYTTEPERYGAIVSQFRADSGSRLFQPDTLGTVTVLTNSTGNATDTRLYSAFGVLTLQTGATVCPFGFLGRKGYYGDSNAGILARRRFYDPLNARWRSRDPVPASKNAYDYVDNRPNLFVDPSGKLKINYLQGFRVPGDCAEGLLQMAWDFQLETEAPCDGYFVQNVRHWCSYLQCPCTAPALNTHTRPPDYEYWEAWHVSEGNVLADIRLDPLFGGRNWTFTDRFAIPFNAADMDGCGYHYMSGTVRFYCAEDVELVGLPIPGLFPIGTGESPWWREWRMGTACGKVADAGGLQATDDILQVLFWLFNEPEEGPAHHELGRRWQCCPCARTLDKKIAKPIAKKP